jgi:hypothetical protein
MKEEFPDLAHNIAVEGETNDVMSRASDGKTFTVNQNKEIFFK